MEKRGVISPGLTPPEQEDTSARSPEITAACEKKAETELDAIRRLDGDFRKLTADRVRKTI